MRLHPLHILIERSDYEDDMAFYPIIGESVTCKGSR